MNHPRMMPEIDSGPHVNESNIRYQRTAVLDWQQSSPALSCHAFVISIFLMLLYLTLSVKAVFAQGAPAPVANPDLAPSCGLNVVLVLDESGSIAQNNAIGEVRDAANTFLAGLNNTGS